MHPAVTLAMFLASFAAAAAATPCAVPAGWRVILASDGVDPDVFVWDSRVRLVDYVAGRWNDTKAIFAHTVLAPSGTEAIVVSCSPGAAHPKYSSAELDVIGVKVTRGQFRGRYGWVLSTDAHPIRENR